MRSGERGDSKKWLNHIGSFKVMARSFDFMLNEMECTEGLSTATTSSDLGFDRIVLSCLLGID